MLSNYYVLPGVWPSHPEHLLESRILQQGRQGSGFRALSSGFRGGHVSSWGLEFRVWGGYRDYKEGAIMCSNSYAMLVGSVCLGLGLRIYSLALLLLIDMLAG